MKKIAKILLMLCLIVGASLAGGYLREIVTAQASQSVVQERPQGSTGGKVRQPDAEALEKLGLEPFVSQLPVLMIDTGDQQIFKESTTWVNVAVLDAPSGENDIFAQPQDVLTATVKYRGASSYSGFDKPQYRLKFYKEPEGKALDYDLFGLGADSEWVLNGPYLDRSLLRNYLVYSLSGQIMEWAPGCAFFELFVDGRYQGVYLAVEPVTDGASRLRLGQFGLISGATAYIVKRDRVGTEINVLHTYGETAGYTGNELSVSYPGQSSLTISQKNWIEEDISQFERALYADYFADEELGYRAYIDVDSFVDYFILNEFAMNRDGGVLSTYAYKELGGKLQMCVWDFNNGFDNYQWFGMDTEQFYMPLNYWFDRLVQDRGFVEKVEERYRQLRQGSLSDENIRGLLDQGQRTLGQAVDRNFAQWGYTLDSRMLARGVDGQVRDPSTYQQAVEILEDNIWARLAFLDSSIDSLYQYCIN